MAAPEYVPVKPMDDVRVYASPPRRPAPWMANRPGDLDARPSGVRFGHPGPDQGYALLLAHGYEAEIHLGEGEHHDDVIEGVVGVALKRASLRGRAPAVHDLTVAFTVWGFLDPDPPAELRAMRRDLFAEAANPLHYVAQRRIVDAVPAATLMRSESDIAAAYASDWRALLHLEEAQPDIA